MFGNCALLKQLCQLANAHPQLHLYVASRERAHPAVASCLAAHGRMAQTHVRRPHPASILGAALASAQLNLSHTLSLLQAELADAIVWANECCLAHDITLAETNDTPVFLRRAESGRLDGTSKHECGPCAGHTLVHLGVGQRDGTTRTPKRLVERTEQHHTPMLPARQLEPTQRVTAGCARSREATCVVHVQVKLRMCVGELTQLLERCTVAKHGVLGARVSQQLVLEGSDALGEKIHAIVRESL